jgi:hypothetical protein
VEEADVSTDPGDGGEHRSSAPPLLLVGLCLAAPILVLVVALAQRTWYPTGDLAQAELRMRSLPFHPPLVGAAGRIADHQGRQGNHPGPLMFWVTWPLYALLGRSSWAYEAATALVGLAWLGLATWLVRARTGAAACAGFALVALLMLGGFGLDGLSQPWNPWAGLFPFAALLVAAWAGLDGWRWAPIVATAAGSYAVQSHVGYLPLAVPLVVLATAGPIWRWARDGRVEPAGRWVIPVIGSLVLGVAAWSGPAVDVLTNSPNNLHKLADNFGSPDQPAIGLHHGLQAVLEGANPVGPWLRGGTAIEGSSLPGLVFLLAWAAVALIGARRHRNQLLDRLNLVLASATVLAVLTVSRIFGTPFLYVFRWITVLVALQVFSLAWGLVGLVPRGTRLRPRWLLAMSSIVLVVVSVAMSVRVARQEIPFDQSWKTEQRLAPRTAARLDHQKRYLVRWDDPLYLGGIGFGLLLDLERRGFSVGADPERIAAVEPRRVRCPGEYDAVLTVVSGPLTIKSYLARPGFRLLATADPRSDVAQYQRRFARLRRLLARSGNPLSAFDTERSLNVLLFSASTTPAEAALASYLVLGGAPTAVFVQPAAAAQPIDTTSILNEACRGT